MKNFFKRIAELLLQFNKGKELETPHDEIEAKGELATTSTYKP